MKRASLVAVWAIACAACGGSDATTLPGVDGGSDVVTPIDGAAGRTTPDGSLPDAAPTDGATDALVADAGKLPVRLIVAGKSASNGGVFIWDDPDSIATAVAPTTTLTDSSVNAGSTSVALLDKRIFVGIEAGASASATALAAFDGADVVAGAAAPAAKIPASAFVGGDPGIQRIFPNKASDTVWTQSFTQGTQLLTGAATMTSATTSKARFTHNFQQVPGLAYDSTSDRLFLGQISGAGLLAWNAAKTKTGTPANDFTTLALSVWSMATQPNRLYGGGVMNNGGNTNAVMVWTNASGVASSTAPTFTMTAASGINAFVPEVALSSNDVLVVTLLNNKVNLYASASTLSGDKAPTASANTNLNNPKRAILSKTDHLFVLDSEGVAIFKTASTTPTFVAKVKVPSGTANDIALYE
jgi:hypothetical protein